jgi:hypothetical protein
LFFTTRLLDSKLSTFPVAHFPNLTISNIMALAAAGQVLQRAVELEKQGKLSEAFVWYVSGLALKTWEAIGSNPTNHLQLC